MQKHLKVKRLLGLVVGHHNARSQAAGLQRHAVQQRKVIGPQGLELRVGGRRRQAKVELHAVGRRLGRYVRLGRRTAQKLPPRRPRQAVLRQLARRHVGGRLAKHREHDGDAAAHSLGAVQHGTLAQPQPLLGRAAPDSALPREHGGTGQQHLDGLARGQDGSDTVADEVDARLGRGRGGGGEGAGLVAAVHSGGG